MDPVNGSSGSCSPNQHSEPTPGCRNASTNSPPRHASSSSLTSPSQVLDVDMRQAGVFTSLEGSPTSNVCRFSGLELGHGMCDVRGLDLGAFEPSNTYRHQGVRMPAIDSLQESSELLAQCSQLIPDEACEKYVHLDDLDSLLFDCSGVLGFSNQPQFANSPDSGTLETYETMSSSGHSVGDLEVRGDQIATTTSSGSVGTSTVRVPGKRKCPEGNQAAGGHDDVVAPSTRQEHSTDIQAQQKHMVRGPKRPDKSTRHTIQTRSDVDIVDDGYRWRKYGQKPVKNSAHPRNYYRCTTPNCPVRKQVERCTENPHNVLTTYDGIHNHPGNPSHSARESISPFNAPGNAEDILTTSTPGTARIGYQDIGLLGRRRLSVHSNYIPPILLEHMLTSALFEPGRWLNPAPPLVGALVSQRNIDFLRMHQYFMMQYQPQYPLPSNMLNLIRNHSLARPPFLDPSLALLAAQNYGMGPRQASSESSSRPLDQQASRSTHLSRVQQWFLRMQELTGERFLSEHKSQQASESSTEHHEGIDSLDLGDP